MENFNSTSSNMTNSSNLYYLNDNFAYYVIEIAKGLRLYFVPILFVFGLLGNFFFILIFYLSNLKYQASMQYLLGLAIVDNMYLIFSGIVYNFIPIPLGYFVCKIINFFTHLSTFLSSSFVFIFTIERFIVVKYPFRKRFWCTAKGVRQKMLLSTIIGCLIYSLFIIAYYHKSENNICYYYKKYERILFIFVIVDGFVTFLVPVTVILIFNCLIILELLRLLKRNESKFLRRQKSVTVLLFVSSFSFIFFNCPYQIMRSMIMIKHGFLKHEDSLRRHIFLTHLFSFLYIGQYAFNFYLYIAFSGSFQKAVKDLIIRITKKLCTRRIIHRSSYSRVFVLTR